MRIVVVGGGIAGLAAAHRLIEGAREAEVVLLEQAPVLGGKLRTTTIAGGLVERGAEAFITSDPSAADLAHAVGLGASLTQPTPAKAAIAVGGTLRDIPPDTLMGIPLKPVPGIRDEPSKTALLAPGTDLAVGDLVRPRRGDAVVDTYVEPLLGGVYAGRADALSLRMALPAVATAAESAHTLTDALAAAVAASAGRPGFNTVVGGMSRLVDAVARRLPDVRLDSAVRELHATATGWRLVVGATREPSTVECDAVVLAIPAAPAARLLSTVEGVVPVPLDYASVALVALAFDRVALPEMSGFLVPPKEGFAVKAATFFDRKWAHHRRDDGVRVVRASLGRAGETGVLQQRDDDLVALVRLELAKLLGTDSLPGPVDASVFRWGGGLPQYASGHRIRVERLRAGLDGRAPIAVAGAAYDGVGIPACVRSGRAAADAVLRRLGG